MVDRHVEVERSGELDVFERLAAEGDADAVEILRPKYLLQENVAALVSEKFLPDFKLWIKRLEDLGYVTKWALLNAKDIGMEGTGPVPQNRLRVFAISMRKDCAFDYQFPAPMPLTKRLKDILEPEVDEKYFLRDDAVSKFLKANDKDTALFHQFALPPTHEDAMFLKTYWHIIMASIGWDITPSALEKELTDRTPRFMELWEHWKATGEFPSKEFEDDWKENMKR